VVNSLFVIVELILLSVNAETL